MFELVCNGFLERVRQPVDRVWFGRGTFILRLYHVSPRSVTRGVGGMQHESLDRGMVQLRVGLREKNDFDSVAAALNNWVKVFPSGQTALKFATSFGNTASGAFGKQIKMECLMPKSKQH